MMLDLSINNSTDLLKLYTTLLMLIELEKARNRRQIERINEQGQCIICLEALRVSYKVCGCECKCLAHKKCIERWLRQHNSCPICRI